MGRGREKKPLPESYKLRDSAPVWGWLYESGQVSPSPVLSVYEGRKWSLETSGAGDEDREDADAVTHGAGA